MKIPSIRFYLPEDYPSVVEIFKSHGFSPPPQDEIRLNGMVAHDEKTGDLIGFMWAMVANGVPVAYIDHFVIHREHRGSATALVMGSVMLNFLKKNGVQRVVMIVPWGHKSALRMFERRGALNMGEFTVMNFGLMESEDAVIDKATVEQQPEVGRDQEPVQLRN